MEKVPSKLSVILSTELRGKNWNTHTKNVYKILGILGILVL